MNSNTTDDFEASLLSNDSKRKYMIHLFNRIASRYDLIRLLVFLGHTSLWYRKALSDLELKSNDKVLDVGCGTGESTRYIKRLYPQVEIEGLDISSGMLEIASKKDTQGHYFEGDVCNIPRPDGCYDLVLTCFTFRNFPDAELALNEMMRILRPGGRLLILDHFYPQSPVWRIIYTFWMVKVAPKIAGLFIDDTKPYHYLAKSIIHQLKFVDFIQRLENKGLQVVASNLYSGGASGRLIAICNKQS